MVKNYLFKFYLFFCFPLLFQLLVPPQITPFTFGEDTLNSGDSTGVQCMVVKGDTPINIKWTHGSAPVVSGENGITIIKISSQMSVLSIGSINEKHRGIFKCVVENKAGMAEHSSELHVNGI